MARPLPLIMGRCGGKVCGPREATTLDNEALASAGMPPFPYMLLALAPKVMISGFPLREVVREALAGRVTAHHSCLLTEHLSTLEYVDEAITRVSGEIAQRRTAEQAAMALLETLPEVGQRGPYLVLDAPPARAPVYGGRGGPPGGLSVRAGRAHGVLRACGKCSLYAMDRARHDALAGICPVWAFSMVFPCGARRADAPDLSSPTWRLVSRRWRV
jgi:hypothetical protein